MQQRGTMWHGLAALAVLASCGLGVFAGAGADKLEFQAPENGEAGAVPAIRFSKWKEGVLVKLPDSEAAFGLGLGFTQVTDAGLKELAGLKSLRYLDLRESKMTAACVATLQKDLPACKIDH